MSDKENAGIENTVSNSELIETLEAWQRKFPEYEYRDGAIFLRSEFVRYGCYCDLEPGMEPDGCVIDEGRPTDCIYAKNIKIREQCEYWKPISL